MKPDLRTVRLLAWTGQPLDITVTPHHNAADTDLHIIERDGHRVTTKCDEATIRNNLVHYPGPATVNGTPVETTPFPNLSYLEVITYAPPSVDHSTPKKLDLDGQNPAHRAQNAYIGGVLTHLFIPDTRQHSYHSPDPESKPTSWQAALTINVRPIYHIETPELHHLENNDLMEIYLPRQSELRQTVLERAETQARRTKEHPQAPEPYEGPIYSYFLTAHNPRPFQRNIPIIVHGTPITIDLDDVENPARATSVAQALYQSGQHPVPVKTGTVADEQPPLPAITECRVLKEKYTTNPKHHWSMEPVPSLSLELTTDTIGPIEVKADFDLAGASFNDIHVTYVPPNADTEILGNAMVAAYWSDDHFPDLDCMMEALEQRDKQVNHMLLAAFQNPLEAFRNTLHDFADSFCTNLPKPDHPTSERSTDGRILVTYLPPKE